MPVTPFEAAGVRAEMHKLKPDKPPSWKGGPPDWDAFDVPYGALTAYAVIVDGERIGTVTKHEGTSHRKSGRLITRTFHPTIWRAELSEFKRHHRGGEWSRGHGIAGDSRVGYEHQSRAEAAKALVRRWLEAREALTDA
jgi:hypothetical protein